MTYASEPITWILTAALLIVCWPLAQRLRHEKLQPLAAYLLFVSVFFLVAGGLFWALTLLVTLAMPDAAMGNVAAGVIAFVALVTGFFAGRWILRFPQRRKMPR